ncbi:MAG TPA: hypothetical protein VE174_06975 [Actinomycetota bacterium]|nr:hypothetical protein [Actinomycetota bacterium]
MSDNYSDAGASPRSSTAALGMIIHLILLVWLGPIAFSDHGQLAPDWMETLVPFSCLTLPLAIAVVGRSKRSYRKAALLGLVFATLFFIGPGIFLLIPTLCYAHAGYSGNDRSHA